MPRPVIADLTVPQDSVVALDRALASLSTLPNSNTVRPNTFIEGMKIFFCSAYDALKILVPIHVGTRRASWITATELTDLESAVIGPELPNTSQELRYNLSDDTEDSEDVRQPAMGEQQGPMEALSSHSYQAVMWRAARLVGPLSLIVVPGLVLGVVTGQLPWGIALCGAVATVLNLLLGLHK